MKEIKVWGGESIWSVCKNLEKHAPAFATFNGIRIESEKGDDYDTIIARWDILKEITIIHES